MQKMRKSIAFIIVLQAHSRDVGFLQYLNGGQFLGFAINFCVFFSPLINNSECRGSRDFILVDIEKFAWISTEGIRLNLDFTAPHIIS